MEEAGVASYYVGMDAGTTSRICLATAAVAALHSALASTQAKDLARRVWGERNRNAFYRPLYIAQSVVSFGGLIVYIGSLPNKTVWQASTKTGVTFNLVRAAALVAMVSAVKQIHLKRLTGLDGVQKWRSGEPDVPSEPEAQGPNLEENRPVTGPFRSRDIP